MNWVCNGNVCTVNISALIYSIIFVARVFSRNMVMADGTPRNRNQFHARRDCITNNHDKFSRRICTQ